MRWGRVAYLVCLGGVAAQIGRYQALLPERVYGVSMSGVPRAHVLGFYLAIVAFSVFMALMVPALAPRWPGYDIAQTLDTEYWFAPERRQETISFLENWCGAVAALGLVFTAIGMGAICADNVRPPDAAPIILPIWFWLLVGFASLGVTAWHRWHFTRPDEIEP